MSPKSLTVSNRLARFNRRITNPIVRIFAGRRLSPVAIVVHRGRTSGRHYRTPVVAFATDGGYLVSLPYGAEREWVRNVLAAGSCTLERAGQRIPLIEPTLLGQREGAAQLRWPVRKGLRLLRVKAVLMLSADRIVADTHH